MKEGKEKEEEKGVIAGLGARKACDYTKSSQGSTDDSHLPGTSGRKGEGKGEVGEPKAGEVATANRSDSEEDQRKGKAGSEASREGTKRGRASELADEDSDDEPASIRRIIGSNCASTNRMSERSERI